ncbi:MAG: hypothetical protein IPO69_21285 [Saprospiraceae bacterium]|nr:hypothetical protein [Saprospiraceae bacterium]
MGHKLMVFAPVVDQTTFSHLFFDVEGGAPVPNPLIMLDARYDFGTKTGPADRAQAVLEPVMITGSGAGFMVTVATLVSLEHDLKRTYLKWMLSLLLQEAAPAGMCLGSCGSCSRLPPVSSPVIKLNKLIEVVEFSQTDVLPSVPAATLVHSTCKQAPSNFKN